MFQVAAQAGQNVTLVDMNSDILSKAQKSIANNLGRVAKKVYKDNPAEAEKFVTDALAKIKTNTDPAIAVKESDLVVEAIVENLDVKHQLFKKLDGVICFLYLSDKFFSRMVYCFAGSTWYQCDRCSNDIVIEAHVTHSKIQFIIVVYLFTLLLLLMLL